jgi:glycosyltransferase involved in cell wall biosynthesis
MNRFTVLIPVHNEADNIAPLHAELSRELAGFDHEVIVVNDGSTDTTEAELLRHAPEWTVLRTPRVGKSRALELGLARVNTDRVVMMDGDLQDDTTAIPALLAEIEQGADCAVGCRAKRKDGWLIKRFPSFFFNLYLSLLFGFRFLDINTGLKAFRTETLRRIPWFDGVHRFFPLLVFRFGGRVTQLPTRHRPRHAGQAKFNSPLRFIDGFTQALLIRLGRHDRLSAGVRLCRLAPVVTAWVVGATCLFWAHREWYFANYDAAAFVPPMVSYARDGQLVNTFQPSAREWDPQGLGRQVGHGFLPGIVTGTLASQPTYRAVHQVVAGQMLAGLILYALLLGRFTPLRPRNPGLVALLGSMAVVVAGYILINLEGRPEVFAFLTVAACAWAWLSFGVIGRLVTAGVMLSMLAVSHPIAAVLTGLIFLGWLAASCRPGLAVCKPLGIVAVVTAAGIAGWFALYPYGVADWVRGHLVHADATIVGYKASSFWPWVFNLIDGLRGLLFFLAVAATAWQLWHHRRRVHHPVCLAVCAALFGATVWYFALRQGFPVYNVNWLTPFGLVVPLALWPELRNGVSRWTAAGVLAASLLPATLAFVGEQIIREQGLRAGPSPAEIRTLVASLPRSPERPGLVSGQYFHLFDDHTGLVRLTKRFTADEIKNGSFLLVCQSDVRKLAPAPVPGWRLVRHTYQPRYAHVAGRELRSMIRGFSYALYVPEGAGVASLASAALSQPHAGGREINASNQ